MIEERMTTLSVVMGYEILNSVDANESWAFSTFNGVQFEALTNQRYAVVAVRDGDTLQAPVPEPTTALLLMAGVATLGGVLRRRTRPAD
jgi:hypothetical protein